MNQKTKYLILGVFSQLGCLYFVYLSILGGTQENLLFGIVGLALVAGFFFGLSIGSNKK